MPVPIVASICGSFLLVLGVLAYAAPDILGGGKPYQISALSPAFIGLPMEILGALSLAMPAMRKHFMHGAAVFGLLGTIGGLVPWFLRGFDLNETAVKVGLGMALISGVFLVICIKSFRDARKARQATVTGPIQVN